MAEQRYAISSVALLGSFVLPSMRRLRDVCNLLPLIEYIHLRAHAVSGALIPLARIDCFERTQ